MKGKTRWQGDTVQHQQFRQHARRSLGGHATFSWFIMARAWCSASKWASQARPPTDPAVILDGMVSIFPQSSCQNILVDEVAELGFTNVFQNHLICSILSGTSKKSSLVWGSEPFGKCNIQQFMALGSEDLSLLGRGVQWLHCRRRSACGACRAP